MSSGEQSKKSEYQLKPLKPRRNPQKIGVFDIETVSDRPGTWQGTRFKYAGAYDGETYRTFSSVKALVTHLLSKKYQDTIWYAHNGGRFDFQFLYQEFLDRGLVPRIVTQGARITQIQIKVGKKKAGSKSGLHKYTLRDSYALLEESLKKLCEAYAPEQMKLLGNIDFNKEQFDPENRLHWEYLKADCVSLYQILQKFKRMPMIRSVGLKMTIASQALAAVRLMLPFPIKMTPDWLQKVLRKSFAGGRTEIFRHYQEGGAGFDVTSLYPAMMLKPLPVEYLGTTKSWTDFGFHDVTIEVPNDTYIPILWKKMPKLIFPTGKFRGIYFSEELKLAVLHGAKVLIHHKGYAFSQSDQLFTRFVNKLFKYRTFKKGSAADATAKKLLVSGFGKTGEHEYRRSFEQVDLKDPDSWPETFTMWRGEDVFTRLGFVYTKRYKRRPHMLVHIAAAITAYGRMHLASNYLIPNQDHIYYCDTDSAMLSKEIPEVPGLGGLKREYTIRRAFYLLPKAYCIDHGRRGLFCKKRKKWVRYTRKVKAIPWNYLESHPRKFSFNHFKQGKISYEEESFLSLRSALIYKNEFVAVGIRKKVLQSAYDKRKTLPDGNTVPWQIDLEGNYVNGEATCKQGDSRKSGRRALPKTGKGVPPQKRAPS